MSGAGDEKVRILVNSNSNMSRGKYAAAAVHAALTAAGVHPGLPVIVLGGQRDDVLRCATVIRDAGKTEVEPGTPTAGTDWSPALSTPPADDVREALGLSIEKAINVGPVEGVSFAGRIADAVLAAPGIEVRPHGTVTDAEVRVCMCWRQIPDDRYPYGKRHEVTCPCYEEPPTPPANDVREAAQTFAERVGWNWDALDPMWQERFEQAARAVLVRPRGTVTDAEVEAAGRVLYGRTPRTQYGRYIVRAALEAAREVHP